MQFVATLENTLARIGGPNAHLFEMAKDSNTVAGNGVANAWNDGIEGCRPAFVHDVNAVIIDKQ